MDEKSVCANIQRYAEQLNGELQTAFQLGLKVSVTTKSSGLFMQPTAEWVAVRVWRETEMVNVTTAASRLREVKTEE